MLTAQQVIDAIHGSYQTGSKNGHRNVLALLEHMGVNLKTPCIHVAGTNGKGSTCAMLAGVLKAAGCKVGLYTSPFLQHYQERIRINGIPLPDALMVKHGNPLVEAAKTLEAAGDFVTPFEMGTALAFAAFDGEDCDFAIIEVGMGGRLDPTNVFGLPRAQGTSQASRRDCEQSQPLVGASTDLVFGLPRAQGTSQASRRDCEQSQPLVGASTDLVFGLPRAQGTSQPLVSERIPMPVVCAITAIGLDHTGFLGDTLEAIAGEKAGIIKPGVPVVCYPAQESVRRVFAQAAASVGAPCIQLEEQAIVRAESDLYGSTVTYQLENRWENVRVGLPGQYQQRNAMTVLALVEALRKQGHAIPEEAVRRGLQETVWPARLEWAGNVLIDGAHNPQGVAALAAYVDAHLSRQRRVLLSGVLADKLQPDMLSQMAHIARDIVTVTPDTPRAMAAEEYAARLNGCGACAVAADTLAQGLRMALDLAGEDGVVIAAGSLYFAGALRSELGLAWK